MLRIYILLMALLVKASFSKIQGDGFPHIQFFPFSNLTMIWPEYAWHITFYFAFACLAWDYVFQERLYSRKYVLEMGIFAVLMTGELIDFVLRCSMAYFIIEDLNYPFGYDSIIFIVFGIITARKQYLEWRSTL